MALCCFSFETAQGQVPKIISRPQPAIDSNLLTEKLVTFSDTLAEIRRENGQWFLWAGDVRLKDLGPHEADAREVLRLIRYFHLNQWGTVGQPLPLMEYWLCDGRAPQKMGPSFHSTPFDVNSLKIDDGQGQFWLRDGQRPLFVFGSPEDAQQALAVIRKYGFTEIGYVGTGVPVMILLLAGLDKKSGAPGPVIGNSAQVAGKDAAYQKALAAVAQLRPRQLNDASSSLLPQIADERVFFDWRQATVQLDHGDWKLIAGHLTLANFGRMEQDARDALRVIQHYHLTERCSVGRPAPVFTYFLANGQPVRTLFFGLETIPFHVENLLVTNRGSKWAIVDGDRRILDCGTHEENGRQVLQILQKYKIDHLIQVGSGNPAPMTILVRTR
jgi:hypothetical protein